MNQTVVHDIPAREVRWYRKNGKYPQRITRTAQGKEYVIGDWSWNQSNPCKPETIEPQMHYALTEQYE